MDETWTPCWRSEAFAEDLPEPVAPAVVQPGRRAGLWLLAAAPVLLALAGLVGAIAA